MTKREAGMRTERIKAVHGNPPAGYHEHYKGKGEALSRGDKDRWIAPLLKRERCFAPVGQFGPFGPVGQIPPNGAVEKVAQCSILAHVCAVSTKRCRGQSVAQTVLWDVFQQPLTPFY